MNPLDDPATYLLDGSGMFAHIESLGSELASAWCDSAAIELTLVARPASIVVAGMGGSAAAGDYLASAISAHSTIPVSVVRDYVLPAHIGPGSLVLLVSYSGNTEEALACFDASIAAGAQSIAITSGGELARRACLAGVFVHEISYVSPPRAALAHTLAPLLRVAQQLDLMPICDSDIEGAADAHRELITRIETSVRTTLNPAKQLAEQCLGKHPLLFSAGHLDCAVRRTKNQLAENAKVLAAWEPLPEATHNHVVGFEALGSPASIAPIAFETPLLHERVRRRFDVLAELASAAGMPVRRIETSGSSVLADMLEATAWGDCLSGYLALLQGLDPTRTRSLEYMRDGMQQTAPEIEVAGTVAAAPAVSRGNILTG
jgi:glucose/mannose-6-phosphate isomerase